MLLETTFFRKKLLDDHNETKHEIIEDLNLCKKCCLKTHTRAYLDKHKCRKKGRV